MHTTGLGGQLGLDAPGHERVIEEGAWGSTWEERAEG